MLRWLRKRRRRRILARERLDDAVWEQAFGRIAGTAHLDAAQRVRLRQFTLLFLHEKSLEAMQGLELTLPMRVAIAAQACLLVLQLDDGLDAFRGWRTVLVYPGQFRARHEHQDELGIVHVDRHPMSGEAWIGGPVVLSWEDVEESLEWPDDGYNVVVHEFAHKLDMLDGDANGCPVLHKGQDREAWQRDFQMAFTALADAAERGEETEIDEYGAEGPDEFFAVVSEAFFETPTVLRQAMPAVYRHLCAFYRQDPGAGSTDAKPTGAADAAAPPSGRAEIRRRDHPPRGR